MKLGQGNISSSVCQEFCSQGWGSMAHCMVGCPPGAGNYGQQVGGTHPTGMHTCYLFDSYRSLTLSDFDDLDVLMALIF